MAALQRIFYGWYVVYAIALVMTTTAGLAFYAVPVLLEAFVRERAFPVGLASAATASFFVGAGVAGVVAGQLVDRFDPRYIVIFSAILAALALASIGFLHEPWQLFAFYIVFGLAYGGCGLVPTTTIVARWFHARRALALSVASSGLSLGGILITPVAAFLILQLGLAGAAPWLCLIFLLGVVPVTALVVRANPRVMGLEPDGATSPAVQTSEPVSTAPSTSFADAWRSRFFIAIAATFLFALGGQVGGIAHLYRLAATRADLETAVLAVALLAMASLVGRLVVGWLLLWVSSRAMTFALIAVQGGTLVLLALATGPLQVLLAVILFGLTGGAILMMQPLLLGEAFGVRDYGQIYSVSQLVGVVGYAAGPALVGFMYEATDGYTVPYLTIAAATLLGAAALAFSGPARHRA